MGKCFISQLKALATHRPSPRLNLCYIATSSKVLYTDDYSPIEMKTCLDSLPASSQKTLDLSGVLDYLAKAPAKVISSTIQVTRLLPNTTPTF